MATLYEKLGGEPAVSAVVDHFYDIMLADSRISDFFKNTDMEKQRKRQKQFMTMAFGGPNLYEGVDMKAAHDKFQIKDAHFDATWENLEKSLRHFNVSEALIKEVKEVVESTRGDIVNS